MNSYAIHSMVKSYVDEILFFKRTRVPHSEKVLERYIHETSSAYDVQLRTLTRQNDGDSDDDS